MRVHAGIRAAHFTGMRTLILTVLGLLACAHVEPKELTVDEHRNEASLHEQRAQEERQKYDSSAMVRPAPRPQGSTPFGMEGANLGSFNPTEEHLRAADLEMLAANEHLVAARSLLAFEHRACEGMSEAERSACPKTAPCPHFNCPGA